MAEITLKGNPVRTIGNLPKVGNPAPSFTLTDKDLGSKALSDYFGKHVVLNIFPSVDTGTCAASVRQFNQDASEYENTVVLCISKDLPFAQSRFCGAENIENVHMLSEYKDFSFSEAYGVAIEDSPLAGLMSRAVVVINPEGNVSYTEQVSEIANEPNYEAIKNTLKS